MVHKVPNSNGIVDIDRQENKSGYFIVNLDIDDNITVTPENETSITLLPCTFISVPDKIGMRITGASNHRNFMVMSWNVDEGN